MLFKNITAYRCKVPTNKLLVLTLDLDEDAQKQQYTPITDTQISTQGWVSPSGDERLVVLSNNVLAMTLAIEKRTIPTSVVKKHLAKKLAAYEQEHGFKPGRRLTKELKEEVIDELIPQAFPIMKRINVMICPMYDLLLIDTASAAESDEVIKSILRTTSDLPLESLQFDNPISQKLFQWIDDEPPTDQFQVDDSITLESSTGKVKFIDARIDPKELNFRIGLGHCVTELGMTYINNKDLPISFSLTSGGIIRGIKYDETISKQLSSADGEFEGNLLIGSSEMSSLVTDILRELGTVNGEGLI